MKQIEDKYRFSVYLQREHTAFKQAFQFVETIILEHLRAAFILSMIVRIKLFCCYYVFPFEPRHKVACLANH